MNATNTVARFEHIYLRSQQTPGRECLHVVRAVLFVFGIVFLPSRFLWWFVGSVAVATYLVWPFLTGALPFSSAAQDHWQRQRKLRAEYRLGFPPDMIFGGGGLFFGSLIAERISPGSGGLFFLTVLFIPLGLLSYAVHFVSTHAPRRRNSEPSAGGNAGCAL